MPRLLLFLLRVLGPRWQLSPLVARYLADSDRLDRSDNGSAEPIPTQLVPLGAKLWSRGWLNKKFFDTHRDWILPHWATHQLEPTDRAFLPRGLMPVLINLTHRDWSMIGNPGTRAEAIIDPRGLVTPGPDAWSLDTWLQVGDQFFAPSRLRDDQIEQLLFENLPIVITRYEAAGLRVIQEAFAVSNPAGNEWVIASATVENPRGAPRTATLYLGIRPFNPEGVSPIDQFEFRECQSDSYELRVNGALGGFISKPDAVACSDENAGDVAFQIPDLDGSMQASSDAGLASATAAYRLELAPYSKRVLTSVLRLDGRDSEIAAPPWTSPDQVTQLRNETAMRWRELMKRGMRVRVPDDKLQDAFEANKANLLLLHDGDTITPGPWLYHEFWFRDAAFMLHALDQLGYHDQVAQALKRYPRRLRKDGYFVSQHGEWDSNGEAIWSVVEHARLAGDLELLADQYWPILNGAHWIDAMRQKTKRPGTRTRHHGLLPPGLSAEHLGPSDYYYWDDFWGLAGLRAAAFAARLFAKSDDERKLRAGYDAFCADVNASLALAAEQNGARWIPASPYRRADSAMVANLVALYPLRVFTPEDARITATIEELKRVAWQEDAFFHHVGHAGFGTYLSLQVAGCYLYQRRAEAWPIIQWLLKHASSTLTWAEAIHPIARHGGMGDSPHGWASAAYISAVRNALLFEEDQHLVLTPALPQDWTSETLSIQVENAATYFGRVGFTMAFGERAATLVLRTEWREPPEYIEWNLPFAIRTAGGEVSGVEITSDGANSRVRIPSHIRKVVAMW